MKKKAFLTFGVILVFAILAIPKGITTLESKGVLGEIACFIESTAAKVIEHLRTFLTGAVKSDT